MKVGVPASGAPPWASSSSRRTRPKSANLACPFGVNSTLAGLMSRWTNPDSWAAPRRQHDLPGKFRRRIGSSGPSRMSASRSVMTAGHVLHLDEMVAVDTPQVMNRHHVRMKKLAATRASAQNCSRLSGCSKTCSASRIFNGTMAMKPQVLRFVDAGHRPLAEHGLDLIMAHPSTKQGSLKLRRIAVRTSRMDTGAAGDLVRIVSSSVDCIRMNSPRRR